MSTANFIENFEIKNDGGSRQIVNDNICLILLENLKFYPNNFHSRDIFSEREGIIEIDLANQVCSFPFKGAAKKEGEFIKKKYLNKILYLGVFSDEFPLKIQITETDKKTRKYFEKFISLGGDTDKLNVGGSMPWISAGFGILSSLAGFFSEPFEDDIEGIFVGSASFSKDSESILYTLKSNEKSILELRLKIVDLGKVENKSTYRTIISDPKFLWSESKIKDPWPQKMRGGDEDFQEEYTPVSYLLNIKKLKRFNLEVKSGKSANALSFPLKGAYGYLSFQKFICFETLAGYSTDLVDVIPFSIGISLNRSEVNAEVWMNFAKNVLPLLSLDTEAIDDFKEKIDKHGETTISKISELSDSDLTIYSFKGLLLVDKKSILNDDIRGVLKLMDKDDVYQLSIDENIEGTAFNKDFTFGNFSFILKLKKIINPEYG